MGFAVLTTLLWSLSTVLANKSQQAVGPMRANLGRLLLALVFLGLWAFTFGGGFSGAGRDWFLISGLVGMGLGDVAFFAALALLGSRLTIVISQCLSVPIAILVEWLWLGTRLTGAQLGCSVVILGGITLALWPKKDYASAFKVTWLGVAVGTLSAAGQGIGAVLSRKGFELAALAGDPTDGLTAAFQRIIGGILFTTVWFVVLHFMHTRHQPARPAPALRDYRWVVANAFAGPIFGMGTYQMALAVAPSGIVLPITATTPLLVIPVAYWLEGERPLKRSIVGGVIAVAGAVTLTLVH
jgi:drug/metabolite transporter (DMT)-like permease